MARQLYPALLWCLYGVAGLHVLSLAQAFHPSLDSLAHFRLHMAVLLCLGAALLVLLRDWVPAVLVALAAVSAIASMGAAVQGVARFPGADVTLLQFNTRFDNATPEAILSQVAAHSPDVITLQEVSSRTSIVLKRLEAGYPHQLACPFAGVGGVAVLSRHPLTARHCAEGLGLAWVRVGMGSQEVTVASLHLHWPWPYRQSQQIAEMMPLLSTLPRPAVIAGDFNAAPWSSAVARVADATGTAVAPGLRLTFERPVPGLGAMPLLALDHVLVPAGAPADVRTGNRAGSDHLPLVARVLLPGRAVSRRTSPARRRSSPAA